MTERGGMADEGGNKGDWPMHNGEDDPRRMPVVLEPGKTIDQAMTEAAISPIARNANLAKSFARESFGGKEPDLTHTVSILTANCKAVRADNMDQLTDTLTAQVTALDALFTAMVGRAANNMGQYPQAADRYMNIALRAQNSCRVTAEAIARMKRDGKQTVRVVHVHEGGQAVVADTFNAVGTGGLGDAKTERLHEQRTSGATLPSPDTEGNVVPLSRPEGEEAMSPAWGPKYGPAERE